MCEPSFSTMARRAVLIGADQAGLPEIVWTTASKQIAKELDCPIPNIVMSATHTHSGWGPGGPGPGMFHPDPNAPPPPIVGQILDAVRQAKKIRTGAHGIRDSLLVSQREP
jgi:hypothetical protein